MAVLLIMHCSLWNHFPRLERSPEDFSCLIKVSPRSWIIHVSLFISKCDIWCSFSHRWKFTSDKCMATSVIPTPDYGHALKNDGSVTAKWRSVYVRFQSRVNQQIINEGMTELRFSWYNRPLPVPAQTDMPWISFGFYTPCWLYVWPSIWKLLAAIACLPVSLSH